MTSNIEIPRDVMRGALREVYRIAEMLYLALGGEVPEGCEFSRSINATSERCYEVAIITYINELGA